MNISAKNLCLSYGSFEALKEISFELTSPKIYGLLGRNGAGKTSLLSILGSFREQTSGQLLINDEKPFENARIMQQVALMYNKDLSWETGSPTSIVKYMHMFRPDFDLDYAKELIKKFKLEGKKSVAKLSTGQQSAFNVIIGLASRAPITIFDEVYLGMDAPARELFYKELLKDQEMHPRIIILSTHLVSEMEYLFDEVLIIHEGELQYCESYESLVSRGVTVIGNKNVVDGYVRGKTKLHEEQLGDTKSVTLYGELSVTDKAEADELGLSIGPVSLQDLFIQLTKEGDE